MCRIINDTIINRRTQEDFFIKIFTSHFICKGSKRLCGVLLWEGAGDRTETVIFWPPLLWPSTLCLSRSLMLNRRPWGPLCWVLAFFTASYQHLLRTPTHQGSRGPSRPGVAFSTSPHLLRLELELAETQLAPELNCSSNSTELYNRSTPTWSLKSNV